MEFLKEAIPTFLIAYGITLLISWQLQRWAYRRSLREFVRFCRRKGNDEMRFKGQHGIVDAFKLGTKPLPEWYCRALIAGVIKIDLPSVSGIWIKGAGLFAKGFGKAVIGDWVVRYDDGSIHHYKTKNFEAIFQPISDSDGAKNESQISDRLS